MLEGNSLPSIVTLKVSFIKLVRRGRGGGPAKSVLTGLKKGRGGSAVSVRTP